MQIIDYKALDAAIKEAGAAELGDGQAGVSIPNYAEHDENYCRVQEKYGWFGGPVIDCTKVSPQQVRTHLIGVVYELGIEHGKQVIRNQINNILNPR